MSHITTQRLTLAIAPPPVIITTATNLPDGQQGVPYSTLLAATGGAGAPYTWAMASGSTLPPWLTLSTEGVLSGTPTASGDLAITVTATDSQSNTVSRVFDLTIYHGQITTATVSATQVGVLYTTTLTASGGVPPYTWSLTPGCTLPAGLTLSAAGAISGGPLAFGSFVLSVQVTDSEGN